METKLFQEADSWGETSTNGISFDFKPNKQNKVKSKKEKNRKRKLSDEDSCGGKWIR
jgi:hypothetical protein